MNPVDFVLKWEGGYVNDPNDPGGETKWGISKRAYPNLDIRNLTREGAVYIYTKDYLEPLGNSLPPALTLITLNAAVNCGMSRAKKWLAACNGDYREFLRMQIAHYVGLKNRLYIIGWMNRTLDAWNEARKLEG